MPVSCFVFAGRFHLNPAERVQPFTAESKIFSPQFPRNFNTLQPIAKRVDHSAPSGNGIS
jgi:hypothetical protein